MHRNRSLAAVFLVSFFFSIHLALVSYLNSSMLGAHTTATMVSVLFATGSALSIVLLLYAPRLIQRSGMIRVSVIAVLFSAALLYVIGTTHSTSLLLGLFVAYFSLNALILYCIDVLIEHYSADTSTGSIRGVTLTINNIGWVGMPLLVGVVSTRYGFGAVYVMAALVMLISTATLALTQRRFVERQTRPVHFADTFTRVRSLPAVRRIISLNFLLQFFYSWMVLYVPFYIIHTLALSWTALGTVLSVMLIPFVLFQYPAGRIADRLGEKELLIVGLIVMALATTAFALLQAPSVTVLAITLFCTRIGASIVEVMCDTYLFKHVTDTNTGVISLYRAMQPFAYIIGPITGAFLLFVVPYTTLFLILAIVLLLGALYAFRLIDTQ